MKRIRVCLFISSIFIAQLNVCMTPAEGATAGCEEWLAKVVSVQGTVQSRRVDETQWVGVKLHDTFCRGDMIRVQKRSRAAILLPTNAILRLDQETTITFSGLEKQQTSLLEILRGVIYFFSRKPRSLKLATPFVNGAVEGTEFFVRVEKDQTFLSVFEGRVAATNAWGSLLLASGQSATARAGLAPMLRIVVHPRDAVQWALYYPPLMVYSPADFPGGTGNNWQVLVGKSIQFYWNGDLSGAFSSLEQVPAVVKDPSFFIYRAVLLLTVGQIDEANIDIATALRLDPSNADAFSLQAVIAVAQNRKDEALELAEKAVNLDSRSSTARVALSYAEQARFNLQEALRNLEEAVKLNPDNAFAWARLAELWLSFGYLDNALEAAQKAVSLNPSVARTQTVLGFAYLAQFKTVDSQIAFHKAIDLDQGAPLPRVGLGLAKIREGDVKTGRVDIEIAASLDPDSSLIRSYLGKAYYEEKRDELAMAQYDTAKKLDPKDPTPWFYEAILKQTVNRPVEALQDMQQSIALNDNRAVFRSRLLLDEDLAARSASLGRIYNDLGFQQLALVEGWGSLNADPANYSAHRLLADSYAALPRHEIARVSELLQSQLLQPINITPVQPQLAESNLFILEGAGPADLSFNEFNPLFLRNRFALQANGVAGEDDTVGDELVQSTVWNSFSYSLGQFHYETDGFRENNDQDQSIYNAFAQVRLSPKTSIQGEFRYKNFNAGDLELTFNESFIPTLRQKERGRSFRFGMHHASRPGSDILASFIYQNADLDTDVIPDLLELSSDIDQYIGEVRYIFHSAHYDISPGFGYRYKSDKHEENFLGFTSEDDFDTRFANAYVYSQIYLPKEINLTIGASGDFLNGASDDEDRNQFNPKLGLTWNPVPSTTIRAALFRTLQKPGISLQNIDPTLEPTQVAGFNQFFFGAEGDREWRYGIAVDQKFYNNLYGGAEVSARNLDAQLIVGSGPSSEVIRRDWEERQFRAYLYWAPYSQLAFSAEYLYEHFKREENGGFLGPEEFKNLRTHRVPFSARFFHPSGFSAGFTATYVNQNGDFLVPSGFDVATESGDDQFWIVDASISYRLPKRYGLITVAAKNLFDERFNFQDTDPGNPGIFPDRMILLKATLSF